MLFRLGEPGAELPDEEGRCKLSKVFRKMVLADSEGVIVAVVILVITDRASSSSSSSTEPLVETE